MIQSYVYYGILMVCSFYDLPRARMKMTKTTPNIMVSSSTAVGGITLVGMVGEVGAVGIRMVERKGDVVSISMMSGEGEVMGVTMVEREGDVVGIGMVGREGDVAVVVVKVLGVAEGAVAVVETTANPGGEERGDDGSPGAGVGEVTVAVIVYTNLFTKV